ncbi:MAG TPA: hypothetical protein VGX92_07410 [Pyrinomonadaceae bacterium]|jgi:hypothetical protein|nr:hypothetical protein [Pyrinomonadaceae bacterium]
MLDELRKPFFIIALLLMLFVVLVEIGSAAWVDVGTPKTAQLASALDADTPGYGIVYLSFLDGFVLYITLLIGLSLIIPERIQGRVQGCVTLIVSFFGCLGIITAIFVALAMLILMVTLLLSPIFGTVAYFALYADFDRSSASITLGLIMMLKLGFAICLVLAHQRFLQSKGLVLIVLTSLLANIIISFLHSFVPGILVSITDVIGAIVVAILAVIWAIFLMIMAIISIIKAIH